MENEGKNARGASEVSAANTNAECRDACLAIPITQCAAYEFDTRDNGCWIHATVPATLSDLTGVNHYTREENTNCAVSPSK